MKFNATYKKPSKTGTTKLYFRTTHFKKLVLPNSTTLLNETEDIKPGTAYFTSTGCKALNLVQISKSAELRIQLTINWFNQIK